MVGVTKKTSNVALPPEMMGMIFRKFMIIADPIQVRDPGPTPWTPIADVCHDWREILFRDPESFQWIKLDAEFDEYGYDEKDPEDEDSKMTELCYEVMSTRLLKQLSLAKRPIKLSLAGSPNETPFAHSIMKKFYQLLVDELPEMVTYSELQRGWFIRILGDLEPNRYQSLTHLRFCQPYARDGTPEDTEEGTHKDLPEQISLPNLRLLYLCRYEYTGSILKMFDAPLLEELLIELPYLAVTLKDLLLKFTQLRKVTLDIFLNARATIDGSSRSDDKPVNVVLHPHVHTVKVVNSSLRGLPDEWTRWFPSMRTLIYFDDPSHRSPRQSNLMKPIPGVEKLELLGTTRETMVAGSRKYTAWLHKLVNLRVLVFGKTKPISNFSMQLTNEWSHPSIDSLAAPNWKYFFSFFKDLKTVHEGAAGNTITCPKLEEIQFNGIKFHRELLVSLITDLQARDELVSRSGGQWASSKIKFYKCTFGSLDSGDVGVVLPDCDGLGLKEFVSRMMVLLDEHNTS